MLPCIMKGECADTAMELYNALSPKSQCWLLYNTLGLWRVHQVCVFNKQFCSMCVNTTICIELFFVSDFSVIYQCVSIQLYVHTIRFNSDKRLAYFFRESSGV